jgi:Na+/H+ antiporter NhaA
VIVTDPSGTTAWHRRTTPLKRFLETETGGSAVLLGAVLVAVAWANLDPRTYESVWQAHLSLELAGHGISLSVQEWINSGLMAFFFFVVGLEARREFDLGELRQRSRLALPLLAGLGGVIIPVLIYLSINAGRPSAHAWGAAMNTDTALALGILTVAGRSLPGRLRVFLLTVSVVDDLLALLVIGIVYSGPTKVIALVIGFAFFGLVLLARALNIQVGLVYFLLAAICWLAVLKSGVDPIVVGLAMGLIAYAYPAGRSDLERATDLFRRFREQPTPELARDARTGVRLAISPNDRLQAIYHPWTSYLIVPLFALANAGVVLNGRALSDALTSPITIGIVLGYLIGKPIGIAGFTWLVTILSRGRIRPPVGWASVLGTGAVAGVGFTVSLLIASIALTGAQLQQAKIGILASAIGAFGLTWAVVRITARLPRKRRAKALYGTANIIADLSVPVDPERDHIRGPRTAPVTMVEYGDFECPYCGQAEPVVRALLADFGDVRYVWRHLPLTDVHPQAQLAAEAAEAAGVQDEFWAMHDKIFEHQDALHLDDLIGYAEEIGLDLDLFRQAMEDRRGASQVASDVESADLSSVSGTPTFFINDRRHYGKYDIETLSAAVRTARVQAGISKSSGRGPRASRAEGTAS